MSTRIRIRKCLPLTLELCMFAAAIAAICLFAGCRVPPGTHAQNTVTGFKLRPFGESPQAPSFDLGICSSQFETPAPADAGPSFIRSDVQLPLGTRATTTGGIGPVGDQVARGGQSLVGVITALHPITGRSALIPFEFPVPAPPKQPATQ